MMYADYSYYISEYMGDLIPPGVDFNRCAAQASRYIDYYTMGKAAKSKDVDAVKMACCAIAEQYYTINNAQKAAVKAAESGGVGEIQSESVGSYSRTYRSNGDVASSARSSLAQIAKQYLAGTGLLYRGGCLCTHRTQ